MPPRPLTIFTTFVMASIALIASAREDSANAAATQPPTGTLKGSITLPADRPIPEMVIYLERATQDNTTTTAPASPPTFTITQKEGKFIPSFLVVPVGAKVEFRNDEDTDLEHNVFSRSTPKPFDLGLAGPKEPPKTITFDKPGEVALYCSVHRYMDATIYVTPTPHAAQPAKDGTFEIKDIPPGDWKLKTWQRRKRYADAELPITITAGTETKTTVEMKR